MFYCKDTQSPPICPISSLKNKKHTSFLTLDLLKHEEISKFVDQLYNEH